MAKIHQCVSEKSSIKDRLSGIRNRPELGAPPLPRGFTPASTSVQITLLGAPLATLVVRLRVPTDTVAAQRPTPYAAAMGLTVATKDIPVT